MPVLALRGSGLRDRLAAASPRARALVPDRGRHDVASWCYGLALAFWAASWNFRLSVLMSWIPLEPVQVASVLLVVCVVHRLGRRLVVQPSVAGPVLVLVLSFLPGVLGSAPGNYPASKVQSLALVVLPAFVVALLLLDTHRARQGWVAAQAVLGTVVAVAAVASGGAGGQGRLTLASVDTISTARPVGAAVVVLLLVFLLRSRGRWLLLPLIALNGVVLVYVGSRGPALYAVVAVFVVVGFAVSFRRGRAVRLASVALVGVLAYVYALVGGGEGGLRIAGSLRSDLHDDTRVLLLRSALELGSGHLWGIGWGDFGTASPIGQQLANAQGAAYPHNAFAEAFAEGGVTALLGLALVVCLAIVRLWRGSSRAVEALLLGTGIYWLLNAQVSSDFVGNRFMWISLACGLVAARPLPDKRRKPPGPGVGGAEDARTTRRSARRPGENVAGSPRRTTPIG